MGDFSKSLSRRIATSNAHIARATKRIDDDIMDASHDANKVRRQSKTGYVMLLNCAPVVWFSKRQPTVDSSTFSTKFLALKVCLVAIDHLQFKLQCFGIPCPNGKPSYVYCGTESEINLVFTLGSLFAFYLFCKFYHNSDRMW
jgi:hypothetical protein